MTVKVRKQYLRPLLARATTAADLAGVRGRAKSFRGIPEPHNNVDALYHTVAALKEQVEILTRQRGYKDDSALLLGELDVVYEYISRTLGEWVVRRFAFSAYGSAHCPADTAFPDITATWQPLDIFTVLGETPRLVDVDTVNSTLAFRFPGIYQLSLFGAFTHDEAQAGRQIDIRSVNTVTGAPNLPRTTGVARNAQVSNIALSDLLQITDAGIEQPYRFDIATAGGSADVASVTFLNLAYMVTQHGPWAGKVG